MISTPLATEQFSRNPNKRWYWEGNVQSAIVEFLAWKEYQIHRAANILTKEQGKGIKLATAYRRFWTIDLKKYGIAGSKRGFLGTPNRPGSLVYIAFSRSTVAVIFDSQRDKATRRIAALFLDGKTGSVIGQRSWIGDPIFKKGRR
jgi:hypothetical protein